jgi:hypothetical protein
MKNGNSRRDIDIIVEASGIMGLTDVDEIAQVVASWIAVELRADSVVSPIAEAPRSKECALE